MRVPMLVAVAAFVGNSQCPSSDGSPSSLAPTAPPTAGLLILTVVQPLGGFADITVTGPNHFSEQVTTGGAIGPIAPGDITINAQDVVVGGVTYRATPAMQTVVGTVYDGHAGVYYCSDPCPWMVRSPMPTPRAALAGAALNGIFYAAGGIQGVTYKLALESYDPAADRWSSHAAMPSPRTQFALAEAGGKLYAIGGYAYDQYTVVATMDAYDPATDRWTTRAPMPAPLLNASAVSVGGILYVVGGEDPATAGIMNAYDPSTDSWTTRAPVPTARMSPAVAVLDGRVYVIGGSIPTGYRSGTFTNIIEVYDPATDQWSTLDPMPTARARAAAGAISGRLYVVGGDGLGTPYPSDYHLSADVVVESYDPQSRSWSLEQSRRYTVRTGPDNGAFAVAGGSLYFAGGGRATKDLLEVFTP